MLDYINHIESTDVPALVLLHGYGSNMQDLFSLKPYLPPVNIICLQAPKVLSHESFAWYDINWNNGSKIIDSEEVDRVANEVQNTLSSWIDSNNLKGKLIIGGFSQGAILSLAMLKNAYNADGYVLMSGYMLPEWRYKIWEFDIPVLQTHGTMDQVIPFDWAKSGSELMKGNLFTFKSYPMAHHLNSECIQDVREFVEQF